MVRRCVYIVVSLFVATAMSAQNVWEKPKDDATVVIEKEDKSVKNVVKDAKYLASFTTFFTDLSSFSITTVASSFGFSHTFWALIAVATNRETTIYTHLLTILSFNLNLSAAKVHKLNKKACYYALFFVILLIFIIKEVHKPSHDNFLFIV